MSEVKKVSKGKILLSLLLLLILIFLLGLLNYVKFFANIDINNQTKKENTVTVDDVERKVLEEIVKNFNNDNKLKDYAKNNLTIEATINNKTIKVTSKKEETKEYIFEFENPYLIIKTDSNDEYFEKVFSLMIYANQKRLNNSNNLDKYIQDFLNDEEEYEGLTKDSTEANVLTYKIDISKILKENTENNDSTSSQVEETSSNNNPNSTTEESNNNKEGE